MTTYGQIVDDLGSFLGPRSLQERSVQDARRELTRRGLRLDTKGPNAPDKALHKVQRCFGRALDLRRWELYLLRSKPDMADEREVLERHVRDLTAIAQIDNDSLVVVVGRFLRQLFTHP